jgi:hypothetical protein
VGGGWYGNHFRYNTAVTNVNNTSITNVYVNKTVVNNYDNSTINRTSFNGPGGIDRQPTAEEAAYRAEDRIPATTEQRQHVQMAAQNRNYLASVNHGTPANAAFAAPLNRDNRPMDFERPTSEDRASFAQSGAAREGAYDRPQGEDRMPSDDRTQSDYRAPQSEYHAPQSEYRAPQSEYRAPQTTYRAPNAYHAANGYHAPSAPHYSHAPSHAPSHPHDH